MGPVKYSQFSTHEENIWLEEILYCKFVTNLAKLSRMVFLCN